MSRFKRKEAFLLPLALIALLVTSVIAINGYTFIQNHILSIQHSEELADLSGKQEAFEELALEDKPLKNSSITGQRIDLSGLFNIS